MEIKVGDTVVIQEGLGVITRSGLVNIAGKTSVVKQIMKGVNGVIVLVEIDGVGDFILDATEVSVTSTALIE